MSCKKYCRKCFKFNSLLRLVWSKSTQNVTKICVYCLYWDDNFHHSSLRSRLVLCMFLHKFCIKNWIFKANFLFQDREMCGEEMCDTKICGPNEQCTTCAPNSCNTYSCANPAGLFCKFACVNSPPRCACKPNYSRKTPGAPCTKLICPDECSPPPPPTPGKSMIFYQNKLI